MELLLNEDAMVVPGIGGPLVLPMTRIHRAEARLAELQGVTRDKAGDLLHCFISGFGDARDALAKLRGEHGRAKHAVRRIRGLVVLDKAVDRLRDKNLLSARSPAGSEDLRDSVVDTDPEYCEAVDRLAQLDAAIEHVEGKVEKLKMAYYAASELIRGYDPSRRETSGGTGDEQPGEMTRTENVAAFVQQHAQQDEDDIFGVAG